jgi:D-tyrosyl-tRNA(Tyr) deacylase
MRLVIQRARSGSVTVDGTIVGNIDHGLVVLVGFHQNDEFVDLNATAQKLVGMRIFSNDAGKFDLSVADVSGGILLVPQFTLFAVTSKGKRPDFFLAMKPEKAKAKFEAFVATVRALHPRVETGVFGAMMDVDLVNDGPVTIIHDSPETAPD